ncbi:hypothetical protein JRQ81_009928 [Phrynocephalus forsythii]|uniref:Coiled-coil domain-containing protein 30 n=1 Tax=Phrynocephalus forsythii TaxID=171643 RepID=A0A9Q1ART5_9SAUR|nr:hypothetical protein JRQ81_009928 [Phrynocephalus forsythii]
MTDCLQEEEEEEGKGNETPEAGALSGSLDQEISALLNRIRFLDLTWMPRFSDQDAIPKEELPKSSEEDPRASVAEMDPTKDLERGLLLQGELVRQQVQELQLELLKESQAAKQQQQQQRSLQEKLAQEKARVAEAGRTIAELQQTLREKQQQLEGDVKEAQEKQTKAHRQLLEEQQKRKILDQQAEDLQQQLRLAREKEAQLARTCTEGQLQAQQLQAQLRVLEEEQRTLSNEHLHCQKYSQRLTEQLLATQQEKEATNEELERILEQVDLAVRKNNERKLRHKAKLRRAKETFISEMKQRDLRIRHLENELKLAQSQREENQALIRRMATENEGLLQKKTKLSQRLLDLEEADRSHQQVFSAMQSRLHLFNEENKRLQGRILQLTHQVGALERTLRNIHSHNVEELKSIGFSECQLQTQMRPLPGLSLSVRELPDSHALLKSVKDGQAQEPAEKPLLSPSSFPSPEFSYLNVASPGEPGDLHQEKPAQPFCCDQAQRTGEDL